MKGLIRGAAGLAVVLAMSACNKDETVDLMGPPTGVQATPLTAFTLKGDSVAILLRLVNDRNQAIPAEFTIGNVGPALSVAYDANYRPDYTGGDTLIAPAIKPQQRYFAKGANNGTSTFTASSGGFTTTVTVVVRPKTLENGLSKTTGVLYGDTLTITAPAGVKFTPTSAVSFAAGTSSIASRGADSNTIKVVVGPGTGGVATVTNTYLTYAPTLALAPLATANALTTTAPITTSLSATSGLSAGSIVTITASPGAVFSRTPVITFPTGAVAIQSVSADSTSVNIIIGPGTSGAATITKMGIPKGPGLGVFTVTTTNAISPAVPAITVAPTTVSNAAPNIGDTITVTLAGGLRFIRDSKVLIGGTEAGIASVSADSSTARVIPIRNSTGLVTYQNIVLSFLTTVKLSVSGDKNVAVTNTYAGPTLAGTGTPATAPTIFVPADLGRTVVVTDKGDGSTFNVSAVCSHAGENSCKIYKLVLPVAATLDFKLYHKGNADLGLYTINAAGTVAANISTGANIPDQHGAEVDGLEISNGVAFAAGTYYLLVANYSGLNAVTSLQLAITIR